MLDRIIWTTEFAIAILGVTLASYVTGWSISIIPGILAFSAYGALAITHLTLQIVFARLNRLAVERAGKQPHACHPLSRIAIQIVGRRENAVLFDACLRSMAASAYKVDRVVFVSDGNEEDDLYLADLFLDVFPDGTIIKLDYVLSEVDETRRKELYDEFRQAGKHVCILQPHRHKRHAMYTAFRCLIADDIECILPTDSDTVFFPDTVGALADALSDENIAAATGDVAIFNVQNWLSWLSNKRYWFAFNLERAAQSYFHCVSCISGPLGIYRAALLDPILDDWLHQSFLGRQCTYGDDRHLTAQLLKRGLRVVYTQKARCLTETPTTYMKWLRQQTRWARSFNRELLFNLTYLHRHSLWMTYDLVTQGAFPFFLAASIGMMTAQVTARGNWAIVAVFIGTILFGGLVRSAYAVATTRDWRFLGFVGYGFMYITGLLWCRIYALLTVWNTGWGTAHRKADPRFQYASEFTSRKERPAAAMEVHDNPVSPLDETRQSVATAFDDA